MLNPWTTPSSTYSPTYNPHLPISVCPFTVRPPSPGGCPVTHNCLQDIAQIQLYFFYALLRFLARKCCSALQMYVFITAACIKKEQGAKIIKYGAGGSAKCSTTTTAAAVAVAATTRAEIALTLQAARSAREKIEKHSQHTKHFLHTHRHSVFLCVCVWSCVFLCIHIWLLRARVRNFFCRNFSFSCSTLSFCCSVVASYPTLADCTTETDGTDTRTHTHKHAYTHTHTYTHIHMDKLTDLTGRAVLVLTSLSCCLRCVCVICVQLNL